MTVELSFGPRGAAATISQTASAFGAERMLATSHRVVVLYHRAGPSVQLLGMLAQRGFDVVAARSHIGEDLPDPLSVHAAIVVGAARYSDALRDGSLEAELEWLRQVDAAGGSVLGVGHGARALAVALGGGVEAADRPIRGWVMVDTLVPHRVPTGPWLTWQHDVITLPPGAVQLAHNRLGPQAFRVGRHLAVQFHPEATPETVVDWVTQDDGPIDVSTLLRIVSRDPSVVASCARRLFSTFLSGI
jgi:GMP synthase-like glutamine amidotransferase